MPIRIACPHCQEPLEAPDYAVGRAIQCPQCRALSEVPEIRSQEPVRANPLVASDPTGLNTLLEGLYSQPLANSTLFLGVLALLLFLAPPVSMVLGLMAMGVGAVGRSQTAPPSSSSRPEDDVRDRDAQRIKAKKLNAGMTMGAIGFVLAALLQLVF